MADKFICISLLTSRILNPFFDLIIFKVNKATSCKCDMEKGSKISEALFMIAGYSFLKEIQNESRQMS
jgi:hypothetical protein